MPEIPDQSAEAASVAEPAGLVRGIGRWSLVALVINSVIGAGIFGLPSKVYGEIGVYSLVAFVACAAVVVLVVLCFAEVASRFDATGGPYLFAREAFGPLIGFQIGWLLWLTRLTAFAAICNLLVEYVGYFWSPAETSTWRAAIIVGVVGVLTTINLVGVRTSAVTGNVFTIGKLAPLVLFVVAGTIYIAFFVESGRYQFGRSPDYPSFSKAVLLLVYAFTGFEIPIIASGEIRQPQRNLPFALLLGIGVVVLLYVAIQFVCIGVLPELAASKRPLADASQQFLGGVGAAIVSLGALVSMTGTLNSVVLAASRLPYALAEQGQLPAALTATHGRFRTPYVAILISAALMLALSLSGSFEYALTISTVSRLFVYGATCAALPVLRRRNEQLPAGFVAPGGWAAAAASLLLITWLLVAWLQSDKATTEARDVGIALAAGLLVCLMFRPGSPFASRKGVPLQSKSRP